MAQLYLESTFDRDFMTCENHIPAGDTEEWNEGQEVRRHYRFVLKQETRKPAVPSNDASAQESDQSLRPVYLPSQRPL